MGTPPGPAFRRPPPSPSGPSRFPQHTDSTISYFPDLRRCRAPRAPPEGTHGNPWRGFPEDCRAALGKTPEVSGVKGPIRSLKSNKSKRISAIRGTAAETAARKPWADWQAQPAGRVFGRSPWPPGRPNGGPPALAKRPSLLPTYLPMNLPTNLVIGKTPDFPIFAEFLASLVPSGPVGNPPDQL